MPILYVWARPDVFPDHVEIEVVDDGIVVSAPPRPTVKLSNRDLFLCNWLGPFNVTSGSTVPTRKPWHWSDALDGLLLAALGGVAFIVVRPGQTRRRSKLPATLSLLAFSATVALALWPAIELEISFLIQVPRFMFGFGAIAGLLGVVASIVLRRHLGRWATAIFLALLIPATSWSTFKYVERVDLEAVIASEESEW